MEKRKLCLKKVTGKIGLQNFSITIFGPLKPKARSLPMDMPQSFHFLCCQGKLVCPKKMKVLRYDWPTDFMFLLDILINLAKLYLDSITFRGRARPLNFRIPMHWKKKNSDRSSMTGNSVSNEKFVLKFLALRFWWNVEWMCIDICKYYVLQRSTAIVTVLVFWRNFKNF